jgi:hypothetical protein
VSLVPVAGDFAVDLLPAGGCYFRSGPDTYIIDNIDIDKK